VGIILNGELYTGASISAGEFGQMVIANERGGVRDRHVLERSDERGECALIAGLSGADQCDNVLPIGHDGGEGTSTERICMLALRCHP